MIRRLPPRGRRTGGAARARGDRGTRQRARPDGVDAAVLADLLRQPGRDSAPFPGFRSSVEAYSATFESLHASCPASPRARGPRRADCVPPRRGQPHAGLGIHRYGARDRHCREGRDARRCGPLPLAGATWNNPGRCWIASSTPESQRVGAPDHAVRTSTPRRPSASAQQRRLREERIAWLIDDERGRHASARAGLVPVGPARSRSCSTPSRARRSCATSPSGRASRCISTATARAATSWSCSAAASEYGRPAGAPGAGLRRQVRCVHRAQLLDARELRRRLLGSGAHRRPPDCADGEQRTRCAPALVEQRRERDDDLARDRCRDGAWRSTSPTAFTTLRTRWPRRSRPARSARGSRWAGRRVLNFVGAFLSIEVATTIAKGIVDAGAGDPEIIFAGLVGAILWNVFDLVSRAAVVSSSHALIGGADRRGARRRRHERRRLDGRHRRSSCCRRCSRRSSPASPR